MRMCAERPNAVARACRGVTKRLGGAVKRPFVVRAGVALLAEISVAIAYLYARRRMAGRKTI